VTAIAGEFLGVPAEFHESLGSTNEEALRRAAEGAPEGLVIVAERQTAGRGRLGRSWWDAPGSSLLFSIVLRPSIEVARWPLLGIAMACAAADAGAEAAGTALDVKWPNDVLHAGRKVCGVLAESRVPSPGAPALVVGAGINVNQREGDFPEELRDRATSLRIAAGGGGPLDSRALLAATLGRFERYLGVARGGGSQALRGAVDERLPARGTPVRVIVGDRRLAGTIDEITDNGALRLKLDSDGSVVTVTAGEIE